MDDQPLQVCVCEGIKEARVHSRLPQGASNLIQFILHTHLALTLGDSKAADSVPIDVTGKERKTSGPQTEPLK